MDNRLLIDRLSVRYGFPEVVLNWFVSYLSDRSQRICIDGSISETRIVVQGVPQGSSVFDIATSHNLSFDIYADDIVIFTSFEFYEYTNVWRTLQNCIFYLCNWFNSIFLN